MQPKPVTITATLAAWLPSYQKPHELAAAIDKGDMVRAAGMLWLYGAPGEKRDFSDHVLVGEADVTVRLIPRDEQVRMAVDALQQQLEQARAAFHAKQQEILAEINKLQAITFDAEAA